MLSNGEGPSRTHSFDWRKKKRKGKERKGKKKGWQCFLRVCKVGTARGVSHPSRTMRCDAMRFHRKSRHCPSAEQHAWTVRRDGRRKPCPEPQTTFCYGTTIEVSVDRVLIRSKEQSNRIECQSNRIESNANPTDSGTPTRSTPTTTTSIFLLDGALVPISDCQRVRVQCSYSYSYPYSYPYGRPLRKGSSRHTAHVPYRSWCTVSKAHQSYRNQTKPNQSVPFRSRPARRHTLAMQTNNASCTMKQ